MLQYRQPVKPLYNTMHVDDILMELAERIGILRGEGGVYDIMNHDVDYIIKEDGLNLREPYLLDINTKHTRQEIYEKQVLSWKYNQGETFADVQREGHLVKWQPKKTHYTYYYYPDNQTRHEFYIMNLKHTADRLRANLEKHGVKFPGVADQERDVFRFYNPVPFWTGSPELDDIPPEYDLWAMNWKSPYFSSDVGGCIGNPWLAEVYKKDPWEAVICLNAATAARKGLKDGDWVKVSSRYGSVEGQVRTSQLFHPDAVGISGGYGLGSLHSNPLYRRGPLFNQLITSREDTLDPISGGIELAPCVKIEKKEGGRA